MVVHVFARNQCAESQQLGAHPLHPKLIPKYSRPVYITRPPSMHPDARPHPTLHYFPSHYSLHCVHNTFTPDTSTTPHDGSLYTCEEYVSRGGWVKAITPSLQISLASLHLACFRPVGEERDMQPHIGIAP